MNTLGIDENFLAIEDEFSDFKKSKIVILSAPYEHSVTYGKGAGLGPNGIIEASHYVEFYDDETDKELCFDLGIATLEPIEFGDLVDQDALDLIEKNVANVIENNKFVVTLGGEHTISTAPIKAHYKKYPNMSVLHFDAHSDLRESYLDSKYSHASFMARVAEFFPPSKIVQVGIRAQCIEESIFIKENGVKTFYASAIRRGLHGVDWQQKIVNELSQEIYCTFDVDYFDPAIMAATGTPEPDGFLYNETIEIFRKLRNAGKKIVGLDVVELAPNENMSHCDLTTARLIYKILNLNFY